MVDQSSVPAMSARHLRTLSPVRRPVSLSYVTAGHVIEREAGRRGGGGGGRGERGGGGGKK